MRLSLSTLVVPLLVHLHVALGLRDPPSLRSAKPIARNVSVALFTELEELARIVDISYCVGSTSFGISKPFQCLSRCADFPEFELVTTWNTGPLLSDSCGFIALDHSKDRIVVAFRGTYSIANTIVDLSTVPQKYVPYPGEGDKDGKATSVHFWNRSPIDLEETSHDVESPVKEPRCLNCTVHMGFHRSWTNTQKQILDDVQQQIFLYPNYKLSLVGHSLGGAVAALAGLDFLARGWKPTVTTFGEPRIGNPAFVQYLDERFNLHKSLYEDDTLLRYRRLTHVDDPVPLLPLTEWGYAMHAGEIYISKPSLSPDLSDLQHCRGDFDPECIASQDASVPSDPKAPHEKRDLLSSVKDEIEDVVQEPWGIPSRYKLWQLFFSHRDYFHRLGLCVPGGDPFGGKYLYKYTKEDL